MVSDDWMWLFNINALQSFIPQRIRVEIFNGDGQQRVPVIMEQEGALLVVGGSNPLKGDMLVIGGSMLYAISNVSEEFLVKEADRVELMAMLGLFGAIVSGCQISILERSELRSIHWTAGAVLPFVGFALAMFLFYSTVPVILKISGSTMLNLSLLTSDMWAVLIRIFAYHEKVDWMYFLAFGAVAVGLVVYSGGDKLEDNSRGQLTEASGGGDKARDEEAGVGNSAIGSEAGNVSLSIEYGKHQSCMTGQSSRGFF